MNYFLRKNINHDNWNRGQAILVVVMFCTSILLTIILGIVDPIVNELRLTSDLLRSKASLYAADSGSEDAVFRVKRNMITNYAVPIYLNINGFTATTTVSNTNGTKTIDAVGSVNNNFRKIHTVIVAGVGVDFFYGVLSGIGGFSITGGGTVNGNVYSNGSVTADNGVTVTGSVIAANLSTSTFSTIGGGTYVGSLNVGTSGVGDVWGHTVKGVSAQGTIYCQTGTTNNKACNTSRADPPAQDFSITDENIATWKADGSASTTYNGNYHVDYRGATIGPMKINGNLLVDGGGLLTLAGTIYVTGTVTFSGGGDLALAPGYGSGGGGLISDGIMNLGGSASFAGSGTAGSYPLLITTSNSSSALTVNGSVGAVVLVAQNGTLHLSGGTSARSLSAKQIIIDGGGSVTYDSGLANYNFSSGPSGGWNITSWKEVQ